MEYELERIVFKIIELITCDNDLCKYIKYPSMIPTDEPDFDTSEIVNTHIHPMPKIPKTADNACTFLNIYVDDYLPSNRNRGFCGVVIEIDVLCHLDLWRLDGGVRPYRISQMLKKLIESSNIDEAFSLNELLEMKKHPFSDSYHGYKMFFGLSVKR